MMLRDKKILDRDDSKSTCAYTVNFEKPTVDMNLIRPDIFDITTEEIREHSEKAIFAEIYYDFRMRIENVIYHDPATIVYWKDGTKTVVKCGEDETFDPEKGLAMAISKKSLGNKGNYYNTIKKWLPEEKEEEHPTLAELFFGFKLPKVTESSDIKEDLSSFNMPDIPEIKIPSGTVNGLSSFNIPKRSGRYPYGK